ncbi:hypothetical protein A3D85_01490 [Candidatus Amesbacteria bacterium RIFCSPHIGHO2_02_FULL_47_9]|uniref:Single-stranded DNA-binding protein n=1 Tax=Candidatus Amesbacteria bacterium RIFCSPHIGHO2_01_FULL_48_32b TaxID=1797253 RepID=A0A1F4YCZ4_9BACT|nr:MAG: hypothetical protein A2876_04590 [Candidatus Amesbacteria bacterium RIFCSPHIGHO2_01_FULL_48_32b]OGD04274.1 MAG: hypothetical protein A3D85_01490 [Candidatus Amesbacteria bacterium RIFCSPHIGHO2_02_FULL_47_9]OGD08214.1 MAG: hypothetical protein A2899_03015 [Candidatus Amesbacteria bacterium RIFCSPLOWO2_01_FULL_49_25]
MASRSLNKVMLIGNLTRDPEMRYTPQGTAVCTFGIATNRSWVTDSGDKKEETEFHRIVAWNKLAELCSQLLYKGRRIYVEGRLQTRQWTGQDGQPRTATEIVIEDMLVLDARRQGEEMAAPAPDQDYPDAQNAPAATADDQTATPAKPVKKKKDDNENKEKDEVKTDVAEDIPF